MRGPARRRLRTSALKRELPSSYVQRRPRDRETDNEKHPHLLQPAHPQDLSSPSWKTASIPEENWSRNFSGGAGNGAARRIARSTESSNVESFELVPIFNPVSVPSGPIAKLTVAVRSFEPPVNVHAFFI